MDTNSNENYVLVLEDRTEVKNENEVGKLSVVSDIDEKGNLKTTAAKAEHQAAFLKFNAKDGILKNFMKNFLKQFNNPYRFGLYKVAADNVEKGVNDLQTMLQDKTNPQHQKELQEIGIQFEDYMPQKKLTAIASEKVNWSDFEKVGLSREQLEKSGDLEKLLNWQKTDLITIGVPVGNTTIYTEARLALRTDENGEIGLAMHPIRKEPQLDFPYMGHKFTLQEKEELLTTGNLGKTIELTPKNGEPFAAYISIDPQTNELISLRADRVQIPKVIQGVTLNDTQYKDLVDGKAIQVEGLTAKNGKTYDATLQINAEKKGIEFIFNNKGFKERQQQSNSPQIPTKLCGYTLSEKQREALNNGRTLYLKNMVDKAGNTFNAYVRMDKEENRPRFYKWNPDQKKGKVESVAEGNKIQVAVNNHGKTNEATKHIKEPLKTGQTAPNENQEKQKRNKGRKL